MYLSSPRNGGQGCWMNHLQQQLTSHDDGNEPTSLFSGWKRDSRGMTKMVPLAYASKECIWRGVSWSLCDLMEGRKQLQSQRYSHGNSDFNFFWKKLEISLQGIPSPQVNRRLKLSLAAPFWWVLEFLFLHSLHQILSSSWNRDSI